MSYISQGEFSCRTGPADTVTYRARISGTPSHSASDMASLIHTWVQSGVASIKVGASRFQLDPNCEASLENIHAPDCVEVTKPLTEVPTKKPNETPKPKPEEQSNEDSGSSGGSSADEITCISLCYNCKDQSVFTELTNSPK